MFPSKNGDRRLDIEIEEVVQQSDIEEVFEKSKSLRKDLDELLEKAEKEREIASRKCETFESWSIVLFLVGIAIGLCAQLAGIEAVEGS